MLMLNQCHCAFNIIKHQKMTNQYNCVCIQPSCQREVLAVCISTNHKYITFAHVIRIISTFLSDKLYELTLSLTLGKLQITVQHQQTSKPDMFQLVISVLPIAFQVPIVGVSQQLSGLFPSHLQAPIMGVLQQPICVFPSGFWIAFVGILQ